MKITNRTEPARGYPIAWRPATYHAARYTYSHNIS